MQRLDAHAELTYYNLMGLFQPLMIWLTQKLIFDILHLLVFNNIHTEAIWSKEQLQALVLQAKH